jgi:hypothetical protein
LKPNVSDAQISPIAKSKPPNPSYVTLGPKPTLARITVAAAQLHQTGHSCIAQHFSCAKVGSADKLPLGAGAPMSSLARSLIKWSF